MTFIQENLRYLLLLMLLLLVASLFFYGGSFNLNRTIGWGWDYSSLFFQLIGWLFWLIFITSCYFILNKLKYKLNPIFATFQFVFVAGYLFLCFIPVQSEIFYTIVSTVYWLIWITFLLNLAFLKKDEPEKFIS